MWWKAKVCGLKWKFVVKNKKLNFKIKNWLAQISIKIKFYFYTKIKNFARKFVAGLQLFSSFVAALICSWFQKLQLVWNLTRLKVCSWFV